MNGIQRTATENNGAPGHASRRKSSRAQTSKARLRTILVRESARVRPRLYLSSPAYLIGQGTTGAALVTRIVDEAQHNWGRLPEAVAYTLIDSTAPRFDAHARHFLSIGQDGAGTDPNNGGRMFDGHYRLIRNAVVQSVDRLMKACDPSMPAAKTAREVTRFFILGTGCGGTSGGMLDRTISLVHDVAQDRKIKDARVYVLLVSPEVVTGDISRQLIPRQAQMIESTYGQNIDRILGLMRRPGLVREERPDGGTFCVPAVDRVRAILKADRTNGMVDFSTTDGLISMLAQSLLAYVFTEAGIDLDQRTCDIFELTAPFRADF